MQAVSLGMIFNYSLLPSSQSGRVAPLRGVHSVVIISVGYPVDKCACVPTLHTTAQASAQSICLFLRKKLHRLDGWMVGRLDGWTVGSQSAPPSSVTPTSALQAEPWTLWRQVGVGSSWTKGSFLLQVDPLMTMDESVHIWKE